MFQNGTPLDLDIITIINLFSSALICLRYIMIKIGSAKIPGELKYLSEHFCRGKEFLRFKKLQCS